MIRAGAVALIALLALWPTMERVQAGDGFSQEALFPVGDVFGPLVADPKEPRFFVSLVELQQDDPGTEDITAGLVGLGTTFGLYRWSGENEQKGWQLSFFGAAFSQFNLDAESEDLLNTDYQVGIPLTYKAGRFSARARLYHQSSHLGDEFLLSGAAPDRLNLSIEVIDLLLAWNWDGLRGYAGGGYAIGVDPNELERGIYHAGIDYRSRNSGVIAGVDIQWLEEVDWNSGTSVMVGYAFGRKHPVRRGVSLRLVAYDGVAPFGQFFTDDIEYYGAGLYFEF